MEVFSLLKKFLITIFISLIALVSSATISFALDGECIEDSSGNIVISANGRAATQDRVDGGSELYHYHEHEIN